MKIHSFILVCLIASISVNIAISQNSDCEPDPCPWLIWSQEYEEIIQPLPYKPNCEITALIKKREGFCNGQYIREIQVLRVDANSCIGNEQNFNYLQWFILHHLIIKSREIFQVPFNTEFEMAFRNPSCVQFFENPGPKSYRIMICPVGISECCYFRYNVAMYGDGKDTSYTKLGDVINADSCPVQSLTPPCRNNCDESSYPGTYPPVYEIRSSRDFHHIDEELLIIPNPINSELNIKGIIGYEDPISFEIFNLLGQRLFNQRLTIEGNYINQSFNVAHLLPGMYYYKIDVKGKNTKIGIFFVER